MGDGENDLRMLESVAAAGGVSVSMGNGYDSVKAVAGFVGPTNDQVRTMPSAAGNVCIGVTWNRNQCTGSEGSHA